LTGRDAFLVLILDECWLKVFLFGLRTFAVSFYIKSYLFVRVYKCCKCYGCKIFELILFLEITLNLILVLLADLLLVLFLNYEIFINLLLVHFVDYKHIGEQNLRLIHIHIFPVSWSCMCI
jgi:hypothetical protein